MSEEAQRLLDELRKLSLDERVEIAMELLADLDGATLDSAAEEDVGRAWAVEVGRRAERALSGDDPGTPWSEVEEGIRRRLGKS